MTVLFRWLAYLPLGILQGLGWVLGWITFLGSVTYRRRFLANVHQAELSFWACLPAVGATGMTVAELPRLWLGRAVAVQWRGEALLEAAMQAGKGVVVLTPHVGSFEITASAYASRYGPSGSPLTVLFRPPRQAWLRKLVVASRARPGLVTAASTLAGVKQLIKALKNGQCVGLLPDQVPPLGQGVWAPFFGREAYTMTLSARLALQTGATVLVAWGQRLSWGRGYVVHVCPFGVSLSNDLALAVRQINQEMERVVLGLPGQYLWGYARYKQPRAPGGTDFGANAA